MIHVIKGLWREYKLAKLDKQIIAITNKRAKLRAKQAKLTKKYEKLIKGV